ncbi:aspartate aminotransferase family protein [Dactylosporangium maewongense]|uniref:Aspartate aminotransferase family protein n=2 Tax=Dactylosporangium maewongense TaxID=634393 RepID=A0ABP4PA89_9ACTN
MWSHDRYQEALHKHLLLHFGNHGKFSDGWQPPVLVRGDGVHVWDTQGRRYIDALSSLFCAQLGYSYGDEFAAAASAQLRRLSFNTLWSTAHVPAIELAERISGIAPPGMSKVFFTGGGSEAVESAYKLVRLYHNARGEGRRVKVIARRTAYHGLSLGALAMTGIPALKAPFDPPAISVHHAPNTNRYRTPEVDEAAFAARLLAETEAVILAADPAQVAMLIAEPVQNAGGCLTPPAGYWQGLRALADRYGFLLVADEVITAFGRVDGYFAVATTGIVPDLITVAKGITSAYAPLGAVIINERVAAPLYEPNRPLSHGITFAGHPLSASIALTNLEIFARDEVLANVTKLTPYLAQKMAALRDLPMVADVRGDGFFWAAELAALSGERLGDANREALIRGYLPRKFRELGLIARADDRGDAVVQIGPPLVSTASDLDEMVALLTQALVEAPQELFE